MNIKFYSLSFTIILFLLLSVFLFLALEYPIKAKLFPLIIISLNLVILGVQITIDIHDIRKQVITEEVQKNKLKQQFSFKNIDILLWIAATLFGFLLLGHIFIFFFLPLFYSKLHKESWLTSICLSVGCGMGFYIIFGLLLNLILYEGFLLSLFVG